MMTDEINDTPVLEENVSDPSVDEIDASVPERENSLLPKEITEQFDQLDELKNSIDECVAGAESDLDTAQTARDKKIGLLSGRKAIKQTQESLVNLSERQVDLASIQKQTLEFQMKLFRTLRSVVNFGVGSIAHTRAAIRFLQEKLSGSSETSFDETEQQEILRAIEELKSHEDLFVKQESLSQKMKELERRAKEEAENTEQLLRRVERRGKRLVALSCVIACLAIGALVFSILALLL